MSYVNSNRSGLSFTMWIKTIFIHPNFNPFARLFDPVPRVEIESIFTGSFLKTYGFDGYVPSTTHITMANGAENTFDSLNDDESYFLLPWVILNFFGIPSRPGEDYWQIIRNFFGGWDSLWPFGFTIEGKRFWNILALPFKLGVILPLKLIGIPFKLALNIVKLFTEFLPELIVNYTGLAVLLLAQDPNADSMPGLIANLILRFLVILLVAIVHYAARIVSVLGTAFTSPEKSARDAWEFGRSLDVPVLGTIFGALGAAISIAITTLLWTIALPFAVNQILVLIPQLVPLLTTISQWPIVSSCLNMAQGIYSVLPAAFSTVGSALSTAFGVSINSLVLTVTVSIATIGGLATAIGGRITDTLSNAWTHWEPDMNLGEGVRAMIEAEVPMSYETHSRSTHFKFFAPDKSVNIYANNIYVYSNGSNNIDSILYR